MQTAFSAGEPTVAHWWPTGGKMLVGQRWVGWTKGSWPTSGKSCWPTSSAAGGPTMGQRLCVIWDNECWTLWLSQYKGSAQSVIAVLHTHKEFEGLMDVQTDRRMDGRTDLQMVIISMVPCQGNRGQKRVHCLCIKAIITFNRHYDVTLSQLYSTSFFFI